ncbi:uncharacterized protein ALTATR162_LOCUS2568 [Alternaria atra]|uniref:Rhodopsin domain-containing protein n=1 Tax=Alternaria atra TaxID=119953 RepID=A0A8J2HVL7_9PLEO|nr:uncharacterized protein ALTATR162_LOCUS2568 [Alternaria atra]CAG5150169.1 unnamed protein product [Alternaria atra]
MTSRFPTPEEFASFPPPNYVDPVNQLPLAMAVAIPMTVLVIGFISCRFYCRTVLVNTLGWDDWAMLVAAMMSVGSNIMLIISMLPEYQMGYHLWDIRPLRLFGTMKAAQMGMSSQLLFTAIITFMKVAILLTYIRIFPSKLDKWFCRLMIFYTVSLNTACFFVTLFQCSPASTYWEIFKYINTAKCLNIKAIYYFHSAQNTFSDFVIFLWPVRNLLNVQVSFRQRVTLTSMFSLGVIVCIAGVVRLYYTHLYLVSFDVFWYGATTFIIMSVESGVGVACGCLPGCKPLLNKLFPRAFGNTSLSSSRRRPSTNFLAGKLSSTSAAKSEQGSYRMQPLHSRPDNRRGTTLEKRQQSDVEKQLPAPLQPSNQGLRPPSRAAFTGRRQGDAYTELESNGSKSSIEIFLLQRN